MYVRTNVRAESSEVNSLRAKAFDSTKASVKDFFRLIERGVVAWDEWREDS